MRFRGRNAFGGVVTNAAKDLLLELDLHPDGKRGYFDL